MPFLEDLFEGLSEAAGNEPAVRRIEDRKKRRQNLSDLELQTHTQQILGDVQTLNDRRSKLDPNSATYKKDLSTIDQALHDARQVFTDLYHPENNPGALSKLTGYIESHLGKRKQALATPAAAKQSIDDRIAGVESAAYAPTPGMLSPDEQAKAARITAGLEPRAVPERPETENWVPTTIALPDGREITVQHNTKDGRWQYLDGSDIPKEILSGATVKPTKTDKPPTSNQITIEAYENAFEPPVKWASMTAEQKSFFPRWKAMQTAAETTGQYVMMLPQKDGTIAPITVQRTSNKTFPGTQTPPGLREGLPATPGAARSRITPPSAAGVVAKGDAVGGRLTPPQVAAQKKYNEATGMVKVAEEVASRPHDAINQKRLAVQLERLSAGRFTTQALDYVIKAGWGNSIQQWANNVTTGELPPDIVRQLVDGARQYRDGALAEMKAAGLSAPAGSDEDIDDIVNALKNHKPQ